MADLPINSAPGKGQTLSSAFRSNQFWRSFWKLEEANSEEDKILELVKGLSPEFPIEKEIDGDRSSWIINFDFDCGQKYFLLLECMFYNYDFASKSLMLKNKNTGDSSELGWLDMARAHPFCLKPDEFDLLTEYWKRFDPKWRDSEVPFLLLLDFVGIENPEIAEHYFSELKKMSDRMGIDNDILEIDRWLDFIERENYLWRLENETGWTFGNGEYDCYSLRNICHSGSEDEENFPFKGYHEMIEEVKNRLNS